MRVYKWGMYKIVASRMVQHGFDARSIERFLSMETVGDESGTILEHVFMHDRRFAHADNDIWTIVPSIGLRAYRKINGKLHGSVS